MRERLGFDWTLPEALANGERLIEPDALSSRSAKPHATAARTPGDILEEAAAQWTPQRPLLEEYRKDYLRDQEPARRARNRHAPAGRIAESPAGAALSAAPLSHRRLQCAAPFSEKQEGIFWVNDLSLGVAAPKKKLAEIRQHFGLELTSAHEAYPGHHLQFAIQNRHPSKLRRLAGHSIFYEGWTMWCEQLAVERGLVEGPLCPPAADSRCPLAGPPHRHRLRSARRFIKL